MCKETRKEEPIAGIQVRADGGLDQVRSCGSETWSDLEYILKLEQMLLYDRLDEKKKSQELLHGVWPEPLEGWCWHQLRWEGCR